METAKYSYSNLLTFESVVDLDLGIIKFMIEKYKKSAYFNQYVVNASSENVLKNLLLARENKNPISVLMKKEFMSSIDDMLVDIGTKHMQDVLNHSKPNDILKFTKTLSDSDGVIRCTISCKNELHKQYIKNLDDSINVVIDETDMSTYDCVFLKYVEDVVHYKNMGGKYVYISNYMHNIDRLTGLPNKIILSVSGLNKIRTIDPYVGLTLPKIGGEE